MHHFNFFKWTESFWITSK